MPLFFLLVGILLVIVGVNNKIPDAMALLKEDFHSSDGTASFQVWILAIFIAGSLGYIPAFKPVANAFLTLIVISLLLSNKGFFTKFSFALDGSNAQFAGATGSY